MFSNFLMRESTILSGPHPLQKKRKEKKGKKGRKGREKQTNGKSFIYVGHT